jgi:hypothetical protein
LLALIDIVAGHRSACVGRDGRSAQRRERKRRDYQSHDSLHDYSVHFARLTAG